VELPAQLSSLQLSGASALPPDLPLPARVERVFIERCRRLSTQGQTLMLLAAADDAVSLSVLQRAGEELGVPPGTIDEVEAAGLLSTRGDVASVRHPLVRSAVYQAATSLERRTAHRSLARALAGGDQPDRHAWHRAAAADGPDEEVARLLQAVAEGAERRGGRDAASRAYERAAQLSPDDRDAAARLLGAARTAYGAGQVDRASGLLAASRAIADERVLRADIDRLRCRIEVVAGSAVDAHRIFVASAREVAAEDPARAVEMAAMAGVLRCHAVDSGTRLPDGLLVVEPSADDPLRLQCLKLLVEATERDAAGDPAGALAALGRAVPIGLAAEDRDVLGNLGNVALHLGDATTHRTLFTSMLASARAESSVMEVLYALNRLVISQFATGQWVAAHRSVEESASLARSIGQPSLTTIPEAWEAVLAAHEGADDVESRLAEATSAAARHRLGVMDAPVADLLRWARAVSATRDGDAAASVHHFAQMEVPVLTRLATSARILAAVQAGDDARAEAWTREVEGFADATRSPWALAAALLGRALLAEPDAAPELYAGALAEHDRAGRPYEAACARLAFGEHLRRLGRRVEARGHLKEALETFRDLGAAPLVDRAARELRASGETARKRDPSTLTQLTPTELNIATLVSGGLTNKEVAEQCWISPRTVAFHLRNVFTKTGVTSRAQLAQLGLG
jgi:DNA-binding CsgD family transcriptional regulator